MRRFFVLALLAGALYVGWEIHTQGTERAFGGLFAPLESQNDADTLPATGLSPAAQAVDEPMAGPRHRGPSGRRVQDRARALRDR